MFQFAGYQKKFLTLFDYWSYHSPPCFFYTGMEWQNILAGIKTLRKKTFCGLFFYRNKCNIAREYFDAKLHEIEHYSVFYTNSAHPYLDIDRSESRAENNP